MKKIICILISVIFCFFAGCSTFSAEQYQQPPKHSGADQPTKQEACPGITINDYGNGIYYFVTSYPEEESFANCLSQFLTDHPHLELKGTDVNTLNGTVMGHYVYTKEKSSISK